MTISATNYAQFGGIGGQAGFNARSSQRALQEYKDGRANGRQMRGYLGYEVGILFSFADRNYSHTYINISPNGTPVGEATYNLKLKSMVLGATLGSYVPLGNLGRTSCLAFDWGATALYLSSSTGKVVMASGSTYQRSIHFMQFAAPLCLSFKYGGEAIYDKAEAFSFTFGAGVQPAVAFTNIAGIGNGNTKGSVSPMLKADLGFFAGIQWKIKATYTANSGNLFKAEAGEPGMEGVPPGSKYLITSTPCFNIGVSFMPFSYDWDSSRW